MLLILFLYKKNELIKKALIVFGLAMLWVTNTNYFVTHLTNLVGTYVIWPKPLNISKLEPSKFTLQISKDASKTQYKNLGYAKGHRQAIVILGSGRRLGALDLTEYQHSYGESSFGR